MTVSSEQSSVSYVGNGATTTFAIPYYFLDKTHIVVSLTSSNGVAIPKVLDVDYTVTGAGNQAGGSLTFNVAPPNLSSLVILRVVPVTQLTDYQPNDDFPAESHERALDKLTMITQQLSEEESRALRHPVDSEHYEAENRRIVNLEDPVDQQDAVTKNAMEVYVGEVITAGTGPFNLAQNVIYIDPYGVPKVVQDMSGPQGGKLNGFKQTGTNTVQRDIYEKTRREIELGDYLAGGANDQIQFNNMLADIPNKTVSRLITIGGLQSSYSGTTPRVIVRAGDYSLSDALTLPAYVNLEGEECLITQNGGVTKDIFTGVAYLWQIQGFNTAGGRNAFSFHNDNINSAMVEISNCDVQLANGFGFNTFATGSDGGGNAYSHLSTEFNIHKVRILSCKQAINNACDHMTISQSWIQADKSNITPSTAQIINKGASATDPNALTRMHIKDTFMIPNVGTLGVDRVAGVRWIDNYGSISASQTRFGGENGGMQIVAQLGAPNTGFPWNSTEVAFYGCFLFAGPDGSADSCVLAIQGQVPNRFVMRDCTGPLSSPIIANLSSTNLPAYFAAFEAASGRKAYEYFKIQIDDVNHDLAAYTPIRPMIPAGLAPYNVKGRSTKVRKQTQSISNGLAVNLVSFATIVDDNIGAFSLTNPTRLVMPNGCNKMTINASLIMAVDGAAKTIIFDLVDSGGTYVDGEGELKGINPDADRIKSVFKVSGPPGTYWQLRIRHNAAAALNMLDCQVDITANDYLG
jgi:hypothetical protein